jgi:signal transduction histidine kinase
VGRLAKLIDQLLDVSRISAGRLVYVEALELTSFVGDVVERFRETATAAGCHVDVAEARPIVGNWDRLCLDQIVTNLISNAIKYGRGESIELRVQQCGRAARLSVTDHGIGIEAAARQRIFERFARAVSIRNYPGLGLGLWIVDQCVRALGGTVRAESDLGVGTTFVVELPLERGTTTPDAS